MSTQNIIVAVIVVIVVVLGGYFIYKNMSSPTTGGDQASQTADQNQVQGQDVVVGTGTVAKPGDTVSILYTGKFTDGTVFDSSAVHDNQPIVFTLGAQGLIPGFQIGVNGMREGGKRVLSIPPSLGYGAENVKDPSGKVVIPANSTLVFEVELVKVVSATSTTTSTTAQ